MLRGVRSFFSADDTGAIGPAYAVGILALVAIAGVGFDYGRLAGLDTELQNAADQAALAGATQLDGLDGACARARDAAKTFITNNSRIETDAGGPAITFVGSAAATTDCAEVVDAATNSFIRFYSDKAKTPATGDDDANFIEVKVDARTVRYALTPLVGAISSGLQNAAAMAGLGTSICKVPPVFMCNPNEADAPAGDGVGADFDADGLVGVGVRLLTGSPDVPGNFGFLDTDFGDNSTPSLAAALAWNDVPGDCSPIGQAGLKPGQRDVVFGAFNTRFDITENGANICPSGGTCAAATITRKDLIRDDQCATTSNKGWQEPPNPYRPTTTTPITTGYPDVMGYPRDMCHAISYDGSCSGGVIGDASWDRNAFFHVNYGWSSTDWPTNTGLPTDASRYAVYEWEKTKTADFLANENQTVGTLHARSIPVCRTEAGPSVPDRRRFTMAVVNCEDQGEKISGNDVVDILKWVDVFLVEPAFDRGSGPSARTSDDQVYAEIIGESKIAGNGQPPQEIRRDVPYLVE